VGGVILDWRKVWQPMDKDIAHLGTLARLLESHTRTPQQRALLAIVREITEEKGAINLNYLLEKIEIVFECSVVVEPRKNLEVSH